MGRILKRDIPGQSEKVCRGLRRAKCAETKSRPENGSLHKKEETKEETKEKRKSRFYKAREKREENREKISESIATLDFETDPFSHGNNPKAFACGFRTSRGYEALWGSHTEVIAWARNKCKTFQGYVFAHNGGKFDFVGYLFHKSGSILRGEKALVINSRVVKMRFGSSEIRDSYAILPAPLSAYEKGKIDYQKLHKSVRDKHRSEIMDYLKKDCHELFDLVLEFIIQNGIKAVTAAGAAIASMKELCQSVDCLSQAQDTHFRKWYFGGRVQVNKPGIHEGKFTDYDIKSAYPHAMLESHGISNEFQLIASPRKVENTDFVRFDGMARGCFPIRTKNGLRFPHASGQYHITGWEYNVAKRLGLVGSGKVVFVERPLRHGHFREYVNFHYTAKERAEKEGNKALRLISKILINSGYGKLAQNPEDWREYVFMLPEDAIPDPNPEGWEEEMCDEENGWAVWSRPTPTPGNYYNVSTAASITGYVRARLIEATHGRNWYYCDTDSITLSAKEKLPTGEKLGDFTKEGEFELLLLAGKKLYAKRLTRESCPTKKFADENGIKWEKGYGWKIASKGAKLTPLQISKICNGQEILYKSEAPCLSVKSPVRFVQRRIRATVTLPARRGKEKTKTKHR